MEESTPVYAEENSETRGRSGDKDGAGGAGAKGHDEGIENKWVRDSAIFRWCRVFRPSDSALSSALLFHRSSIPSSSLDFIPRFSPGSSRFCSGVLFGSGAGYLSSFPFLVSSSMPLPFILKAWSSN